MSVTVQAVDTETFEATVAAATTTRHTVRAPAAYVEKLNGDRAAAQRLVERSFAFLLEREPNTSILSSFELAVIQRYFPEYESTMRKAFASDA